MVGRHRAPRPDLWPFVALSSVAVVLLTTAIFILYGLLT